MCTLLELFVYQSPDLSTIADAMRKIVRTVNGISLVNRQCSKYTETGRKCSVRKVDRVSLDEIAEHLEH